MGLMNMRWAKQRGFTIVELLIVIVVIGILAAITIVAFTGVQNRAHDTAVQNDLSNLAKQVRAYHAIEGRYPSQSSFFNAAGGMNLKISKGSYTTAQYNVYYCTDIATGPRAGERFGIAARSKSGQTYTISSASGIATTTRPPQWQSACGAFDETAELASIEFNYAYNQAAGRWQYVFAD